MSLLNYDKKVEIKTKKKSIKKKRINVEDTPTIYNENVCFTINKKKWLIIKQLPRGFYIIRHEDYQNKIFSTQFVSLEDIKKKNIKIIDFLKVKKIEEKKVWNNLQTRKKS